jgi:hypothetical protein
MNSYADNFRITQRIVAFTLTGKRCDLCGADATDYHELVSRSLTVNNEAARYASYDHLICAVLCPKCHTLAHNPITTERLLSVNIDRYGYVQVRSAFNQVKGLMRGHLSIQFPEQNG